MFISQLIFYINRVINVSVLLWAVAAAIVITAVSVLYYVISRRRVKRYFINGMSSSLISVDECTTCFARLAETHQQIKMKSCRRFFNILTQQTYWNLRRIRRRLSAVSQDIITLVPSARWLLGNYYALYMGIKKVQCAGPGQNVLPVLTSGKSRGAPRIYAVAQEIIIRLNTNLSEENLISVLNEYQRETPLTSEELWMLQQTLNLNLLEAIVYITKDILKTIVTKQAADTFMSSKLSLLNNSCDICDILTMNQQIRYLNNVTFVSHVIYSLKNITLDETQINGWSSSVCTALFKSPTPTAIIAEERRLEAYLESETRLLFTSLREIGSYDYTVIFEAVSPIERILRSDPSGVYPTMDYKTRDDYRHALEAFARRYKLTQWDLAEKICMISKAPPLQTRLNHPEHVGTYLVGKGRRLLRSVLRNSRRIPESAVPENRNRGKAYFFILASLFIIFELLLLCILNEADYSLPGIRAVLFLIAAIPLTLGIAIELVNYIFSNLVKPKHLPSLDFKDGLPDDCRTLVVLPVLLGSPGQALDYATRLEKHYLANRQSNLGFAILGDLTDAPERIMPADASIIQAAIDAIDALNSKYPSVPPRFSLLARYRCWNASEGYWLGWERKRGKLEELNALLCGEDSTTYSIFAGNKDVANRFRYVITLDADTDLVRDCAAKLAGTAAHPLNTPVVDTEKLKIIDGYAIIQPVVHNHLYAKACSRFSNTFSGKNGMDTYTNVTSDIYQDTFSEGIFVGKGIYDVAFVHRVLHNTFPENSILSHDLLESCYVRCAFQSQAVLLDNYPSNIEAYTQREHRWIRGDWQLLPWLFKKAPINNVSRWKIADNMRRSLIPICTLVIIFLCIFLVPELFFVWIPLVMFHDVFNLLIPLVRTFVQKLFCPRLHILYRSLGTDVVNLLLQALYTFLLVPYRAYLAADAIIRTLFRLVVSHKNMMQWHAMEHVEQSLGKTAAAYLRRMMPAILIASVTLAGAVVISAAAEKIVTALIGLYWLGSPLFAYLLGKPKQDRCQKTKPRPDELQQLRLHARRIWQFTADFSTAENNWLCPDNYQIYPITKVTDKTSPTNIGLQFLSLMSARDFGYIGLVDFVDACQRLLETTLKLPKWNGHLYNWYNIRTLEVLNPVYVSTVDSGNFIGYILTMKNGLLELLNKPVFDETAVAGIRDTLLLAGCDKELPRAFTSVAGFLETLCDLKNDLTSRQPQPWENTQWIEALEKACDSFAQDAETSASLDKDFSSQPTLRVAADSSPRAALLVSRIERLAEQMSELVNAADFGVLFDGRRSLLRIGYRVHAQMPDDGHYDLAASEALLTSFLTIAKGDVPLRHWKHLGRPLTVVRGIPAFVSWSGTMFEYLMPHLVMRNYNGSVFNQSQRAAVRHQVLYASKEHIPWGISESQYFCFDTDSNYQYKAFGVPKLRLEPGTRSGKIVSPYSTFIAISFAFRKAMQNIRTLETLGALGKYGLYEAVDFDSPDPDSLKEYSIVKSFMAHHLGMSLTAINNFLNNNTMQERFHSEPMVRAAEPLLEEARQSYLTMLARQGYSVDSKQIPPPEDNIESRYINQHSLLYPRVNWLSNGHYSLLITPDGDGFSTCRGMMMHRWRADRYSSYGSYVYIRDIHTGSYWSASYKPTLAEPDEYQVIFQKHQAEFKRRDGDITTNTAVTISTSRNLEIRKLKFLNHGKIKRELETTSYLEVVMASQDADLAHPAFNKMFIESEYIPEKSLLIFRHRKTSAMPRYLMHTIKLDTHATGTVEYETDRLRFIGRCRTPVSPAAMDSRDPLSCTAGFSIDPIASIRTKLTLAPDSSASVSYITAACETREEAIALCDALHRQIQIDDVFEQFRINSNLELKYLNITSARCNQYLDMVGPLFYPVKEMRGPQESMERNWKDQSGMWRFGISGDNPIMLLRTASVEDAPFIRDVLNAYAYLRINSIPVDLVILNEQPDGYKQDLNNILFEMTSTMKVYDTSANKPSLYILQAWQMAQPEIDLFLTTARIVLTSQTGVFFRAVRDRLDDYQAKLIDRPKRPETLRGSKRQRSNESTSGGQSEFFNGIGGFVQDGREYEIILTRETRPPAPWINVIANDSFGFLVSETGAGYTWSLNSRENKLTSWSNDPVTDPPSEAIYVRDDMTGEVFLPCSLGAVDEGRYTIRHGFGYSTFSRDEDSLYQEMTMFVPKEEALRLWQLKLTNKLPNARQLTITLYVELTLGVNHETGSPYVLTAYDQQLNCLTAKSIYNFYFRRQTAFVFASEPITGYTGDRVDFLGIGGSVRCPAGLRAPLSGRIGSGLDPCATVQVRIDMQPGETKCIVFGLGQSEKPGTVAELCLKYRDPETAAEALLEVKNSWIKLMNVIRVDSEDRALDILANGWLLYQTFVCRVLARTAFYQCGGAYGFRDQLQDVLALLEADPQVVKKQILLAASHQYPEGDVQHWWHPHTGQGVRTRMTDDLLWLPYVVSRYVVQTGDASLLDEAVPFITGPALEPEESERMHQAKATDEQVSIHEHCLRALYRVRTGSQELPLMGGGDWNDGMNRIGINGKGESVWLGWFYYTVCIEYASLCGRIGAKPDEVRLKHMAETLKKSIEKHAWDGAWYLRAFYDDGEKLGSAVNKECRIDSISQSWSVISGAADAKHARTAVRSANTLLTKPEDGVSLLLDPPFDKTEKDPGYIKQYYPGMRENGGQYTHAAVWLAIANAMLKNRDAACQLLTLLNPVNATATPVSAAHYVREPYVMAADISTVSPYIGQGGWSWYTGSAGWMYQAIINWFFGLRREGARLIIDPAVPPGFGQFTIQYRYGTACYIITVDPRDHRTDAGAVLRVDGESREGHAILLADDGKTHLVQYG